MAAKSSDGSQGETSKAARVERELPGKVRRTIGKVPFVETAIAAWYCTRDLATPKHVKAVIIGALAYFILPFDIIPDVLIGLGYTDDAAVFWAVWRMVSKYVNETHQSDARKYLSGL